MIQGGVELALVDGVREAGEPPREAGGQVRKPGLSGFGWVRGDYKWVDDVDVRWLI